MKDDPKQKQEVITKLEGQRRYRIVIVTSLHPDFDSRIWKYAKLLASAGHSISLICPWDVENGIRDGVRFVPFKRARSRMGRFLTPYRLLRVLFPLLSKIDLVHFHDLDILPFMTILSLFKKVVYDIHENYPDEIAAKTWLPSPVRAPLAWLVKYGQLACAQQVRNLVLVSKFQERDVYGGRLRITYIKNYASRELIDEVKGDYDSRSPAVILTGSQYLDNGSLLYLEIASRVLRTNKNVIFYAADRFGSDRHFRQEILDEVRLRGLQESYVLLPNIAPHRLMTYLNRATIGVSADLRVTRRIKAVPTKLFEYMAAGLPIVASDLPAQIDLVMGNNAGILARPEEPETFVQAILQLIDNRELASKLGSNGQRAFARLYSWEAQIQTLEAYYRSIMTRSCEGTRNIRRA